MDKPLFNQYTKEEIKKLLKDKTKLVYVDTGVDEVVARYEDLPDVIVDINEKLGSTNLKVYDFDNPSTTPILTTIGYYLDRCDKKVRDDIIDRLLELHTTDIPLKDYKLINEDMLDNVRDSIEQDEEMER